MTACDRTDNHYCGTHKSSFARYCDDPHPDHTEPREVHSLDGTLSTIDVPTVFCRRLENHPGAHAAYVFSISQPETWPAA
jgi:hypothetical protein